MKKSTLLMVLSLVLALTIGLGTTLAYLTDTDSDVNVMTLGNVDITQDEQQWNEDQTELEEFENDKPLYPAVGELGWENDEYMDGAYRQFTMENAVDKYVTVTNTGKSDAYVRTLIAFEMGRLYHEDFDRLVGVSVNSVDGAEYDFPGTWKWDYLVGEFEHEGSYYWVFEAVHQDPVAPDQTTIPSLNQIYLVSEADNYAVEILDGNGNGKYDVIVLSQAVQTNGFDSAEEALNTAFPYKTLDANGNEVADMDIIEEWFINAETSTPGDEWPNNNPPRIPEDATVVANWDELKAALDNKDKEIYLEPGIYRVNNIGSNEKYSVPAGTTIFGMGDVTIEGQLTSTLENVTFESIKFSAGDAMRWAYPKGDVTFKHCEFDGYGVYAIHFDTTNGNVLFEDCDIKGWVAMGSGNGHVTFDNCTVIGNGSYGLIRSYVDTDITNCTFDVSAANTTDSYPEGMQAIGCTFEVTNCTNVNGTMQDLVNEANGGVINIK